MRLCIVVPMYNEAALARESIMMILSYTRQLSIVATVVVVDDGSHDATRTIVDSLVHEVGDTEKLILVAHEHNRGYGAALRTGMHYAIDHGFDYVVYMDSDLTNHPKYLTLFCDKMLEGYDYIKATRYAPGGGMEGVPWKRQMMSRWGNRVARVLFGLPLTDITNGFRALKVSLAAKLQLTESGFPIMMEELYQVQALTRSFAEVPYILTSRQAWQGTTHFGYDLSTLSTYLYYALKSFLSRIYGRTK
ncbi:MAG: glycosyltransferase family 2 protein [bacterium]|nr:glycosyltransferase family 2 protein [bacterium]